MMLLYLLWSFTPLLSDSNALPQTSEPLTERDAVIYSPTDWKLPDYFYKLNPVVMKPRDNEGRALNYCGRWNGWLDTNSWVAVDWKCYQDKDVMAGKPGGLGPCVTLPDRVKGNNRAGFWPGKDVNCILFYDEQCRYSKTDEKGKYIPKLPSVVLQPPGMDALEEGWWQEQSGFRAYKTGDGVPGPKAYQCYFRGKGNIGLGNSQQSQGYAGLGAGF